MSLERYRCEECVGDIYAARLSEKASSLPPALRRVAVFIGQNRGTALSGSAAELARLCDTSDATVVRVAQALGFAGLGELKTVLAAAVDEEPNAATNLRRTLEETGKDPGTAIRGVLEAHRSGLEALEGAETQAAMISAIEALRAANRVFMFGIGPTSAIVQYAAILLERAGVTAKLLDRTGRMLADQLMSLRTDDAVLAIAYTQYPEILAVLREARQLRSKSILITEHRTGKLAKHADIVVPSARGRAERVALHGSTVVCLEALIHGLTALSPTRAITAHERLLRLRREVTT